jgi:hypothetical protein
VSDILRILKKDKKQQVPYLGIHSKIKIIFKERILNIIQLKQNFKDEKQQVKWILKGVKKIIIQ